MILEPIMQPACYLCDSSEDVTRDHIPPSGFFPDPKPSNLITAPCCRKCNESYSKDDEAFRAWITSPANISASGSWILRNKVIKQTFKRSPKMVAHMRASFTEVNFNGKTVGKLEFPASRANRFLVRITKALLSKYYPTFPRHQQQYSITHVVPPMHETIFYNTVRDVSNYDTRGEGVFQFRHLVFPEGGFGLLCFYEAVLFEVRHETTHEIALPRRGQNLQMRPTPPTSS